MNQSIDNAPSKEHNASFPLELQYRLINKYSQKGDTVLDPFMGLGTTAIASILCKRNSIGYEIDPLLKPLQKIYLSINISQANAFLYNRYKKHLYFVEERLKQKKEVKYDNAKLIAR